MCVVGVALVAPLDGSDDQPAGKEPVGRFDGGRQRPAGIVAQVQHESFRPVHPAVQFVQFGGRAIDEFADTEVEDVGPPVQHTVPPPVFVADDAGNGFNFQVCRSQFPGKFLTGASAQTQRYGFVRLRMEHPAGVIERQIGRFDLINGEDFHRAEEFGLVRRAGRHRTDDHKPAFLGGYPQARIQPVSRHPALEGPHAVGGYVGGELIDLSGQTLDSAPTGLAGGGRGVTFL